MKNFKNQLSDAIEHSFNQITNCLEQLTTVEYTTKCSNLFGASVGQHVRHIIELFTELDKGYALGTINYEKRQRDYLIETNKETAIHLLNQILLQIEKPDKELVLEVTYDLENEEMLQIHSNYYRELVYNLEHTVHHMALIRVGVSQVANIEINKEFGIASATIKFRQTCVQ